MGRTSNWCHEDGTNHSTVVAITACIQPFVPDILARGLDVYHSIDSNKGKNAAVLEEFEEMIATFVSLDPRGAHFDIKDIFGGMMTAIDGLQLMADVEATAKVTSQSAPEYIGTLNPSYINSFSKNNIICCLGVGGIVTKMFGIPPLQQDK